MSLSAQTKAWRIIECFQVMPAMPLALLFKWVEIKKTTKLYAIEKPICTVLTILPKREVQECHSKR